MDSMTLSQQKISPLDALWALYQSQSKRVRQAFRARMLAEESRKRNNAEMQAYERGLSPELRTSVRLMATSIKKNVSEVLQAAAENEHVGRPADEFLKELEKVYTHPEFEHQFKRYKKKYHSLVSDFQAFLASIKDNPYQGSSLGKGIRKVRFGIADKGGGKSGGMRVITFTLNKVDDETINITLLYLYDKSEMGNVSDKFLAYLIGQY